MGERLLGELLALPETPNISGQDFPKLHRPEDDGLVEYFTTEYTLQIDTAQRISDRHRSSTARAMSASDFPAFLTPGLAEDEPPFDLDTVHRAHGNWLLAFLRRRFSPQDAEDLAQETYAHAATVRSPIRNPRAFLAKLAINAARDQFRREAVRPMLVGEGEATAKAATPSEAAEAFLQKQIIMSLPPQLREVFLLRSFTPLTNVEIAERCGISVKTVEERMTKALAICKVLLRD